MVTCSETRRPEVSDLLNWGAARGSRAPPILTRDTLLCFIELAQAGSGT